jgi:AhpD family alkylhydroperoxidase
LHHLVHGERVQHFHVTPALQANAFARQPVRIDGIVLQALRDTASRFTRLCRKDHVAVTQVNGCRYCSYAHTRMALKAGVTEDELRQLLAGQFDQLPAAEIIALAFAQHFAEQAGQHDSAAWKRLAEAYGSDVAQDILVYIRLISLANLYDNTFDALLGQLAGRSAPGNHLLDELAVLILGAAGVPLGILITRLSPRAARFLFGTKNPRLNLA